MCDEKKQSKNKFKKFSRLILIKKNVGVPGSPVRWNAHIAAATSCSTLVCRGTEINL